MEQTSRHEWGKQVYELGYLLVPTLPEEQAAEEAKVIKAIIQKAESEFIAEDAPALVTLAYKMTAGAGRKQTFDKGYFGWIKFHASAPAVGVIKTEAQKYPHFLRFMIVKTIKEQTPLSSKPVLKVIAADSSKVFTPTTMPVKTDKPKADINEAELDKSLERLIVE